MARFVQIAGEIIEVYPTPNGLHTLSPHIEQLEDLNNKMDTLIAQSDLSELNNKLSIIIVLLEEIIQLLTKEKPPKKQNA